MFDSALWSLVTILGPIILAAVIAYALWNRRRLTATEKAAQDRKVDELYDDTPEQHRRLEAEAKREERQEASRREPVS